MVACWFGESQVVQLCVRGDNNVESNMFVGLEGVILENLSQLMP